MLINVFLFCLQTQPVPNPMSYYLHQSPEIIHMIETFGNHFVELIAPFFIFLTRPFRIAGGVIQIAFQASQSKEFLQIIKTL